MPTTLAQLKTRLRLRLGEPTAGTWGTVDYEDDSNVDELMVMFNEAQNQLVSDLTTERGSPLIGRLQMAVEADIYQYTLPADFLSVLSLQHYDDNTFYTLNPQPVRFLFDRFDPDATTSSQYLYYDVEGAVAALIDEGTVTSEAANTHTTFNNANTDYTVTGMGITANVDTVENVTDKSTATITSVASGTQIVTDGLTGGTDNTFELGDRVKILSGEQTRRLLWVWPPVTGSDSQEIVAEQTSLSFTVSDQAVLHSIQIKLSATVTDPVSVELQTGGSPVSAVDPESLTTVNVSAVGYNDAIFEYGVRLATSTTYTVVVTDGDGSSVTPTNIKVRGYTGDEYLQLHYARYPRAFSRNTDNLELPPWSEAALLAYAEMLAYNKLFGGRNTQSADARAEYFAEVEQLKRKLRMYDQPRQRAVHLAGGARVIPRHKNVPITVPLPLS